MMAIYSIRVKSGKELAELQCRVIHKVAGNYSVSFKIIAATIPRKTFAKLLKLKSLPAGNVEMLMKEKIRSLFRARVIITIQKVKAPVKKGSAQGRAVKKARPTPLTTEFPLEGAGRGEGVAARSEEGKMGKRAAKMVRAESDFITYDVLYGTNRLPNSNKTDLNNYYSGSLQQKLEVGLCQVSIPKGRRHTSGNIERPSWFTNLFFGESPKRHVTILSIQTKSTAEYVSLLKDKLDQSDGRDALLFIHGYNNSFAESLRRAAQIGYDLSFDGPVLAFTWPSRGTVKGYLSDVDSATLSGKYLQEFLETSLLNTKVNRLHIIAHSMGNVVLTEALLQLQNYPLPEINQIILAAPDIDQAIFIQKIMPRMCRTTIPPRITLYASSNDKALLVSSKIRSLQPRLGMGGEHLFITDGIETIDASEVDTDWLGHGYFAETKTLINDIFLVLKGMPPDKRILVKQQKQTHAGQKPFWILHR
ncbi:MAG TPA: alpha/beta hydrolase [Chryseosolibacter sp.]|nr:alpha/beta hydrolase [Chryseosolibacter sp.]